MKKHQKKLQLSRETLRRLSEGETHGVAGGISGIETECINMGCYSNRCGGGGGSAVCEETSETCVSERAACYSNLAGGSCD